MEDLSKLLSGGGDERIFTNEEGLNKYFVNPAWYKNIIYRGSCTCSPLNPESKVALEALNLRTDAEKYEVLVEEQRKELKHLVNPKVKNKCEVFLASSGSDLNYFPLLFQCLLNPGKPVHNVITAYEELGTGSVTAASGKYFFELNQFGEQVEKGTDISPDLKVVPHLFKARSDNGEILDHGKAMAEKLLQLSSEPAVVGNLVIGSKSGIEDNITIIPRVREDVLWVIDICQVRVTPELINRILDLGAMIMVTGSKFYQAPPFCGALLVPTKIVEKLQKLDDYSPARNFKNIFSKHNFPESLTGLRSEFRNDPNYGLLMRWEAALNEMRQLSKCSVNEVVELTASWFKLVRQIMEDQSDVFELMPDVDLTNKTIISFRIKRKDGTYFDFDELTILFRQIVTRKHVLDGRERRLTLGQPVKYGNEAFMRLALGSYSVRKMMKNGINEQLERDIVNTIRSHSLQQ